MTNGDTTHLHRDTETHATFYIKILLFLQLLFFGCSSFGFDQHRHGDQGGGGEDVVHDVGADHDHVPGGEGGEHEEGDKTPGQLTGPGQGRL